jgi:hypothetical protein
MTRHSILLSVRRLIVSANRVPSLPILVILIIVALHSSETSVLLSEDGILHVFLNTGGWVGHRAGLITV